MTTGEWVSGGFEIHAEDTEWMIWSWQEVFLLEWKIAQAEARGGCMRIASPTGHAPVRRGSDR